MRKSYITKSNNIVHYGIDKVGGVFFQVMDTKNEEGTILNFTEFSPCNKRLTFETVNTALKTKEISKEDYEEICNLELGDFKVTFIGIGTIIKIDDDFEYPKRLINHHRSGRGLKVQTMGDYFKILKLFRHPVTFSISIWDIN